MLAAHIIGSAATICLIFGYLPQAITTMRTRNTDGIAVPTFLAMGLGSVLFVVQGILLGNIPLIIANLITAGCSAIIFGIKIYNDTHKRRKN